jgi:glycosyltransferase involved in cell wall biosynthesis
LDLVGSGFVGMYRAGQALSRAAGSRSLLCVASSPPFACALAAFLVAGRRSDRRLVVDMRDAWAEHSRIYFWRRLRRWVESRVLRRAEMVSTVSRYIAEEFAARRGAAVDVLYNCDTQTQVHATTTATAPRPRGAADTVSIVYVGSLPDGFYDLGAFVEGVAALGREAPDALRRLRFTFIGTGDSLRRLVSQRNELSGVFSFEPPVPHAKAVEAIRTADAVLFFGFNAPRNAGVVSTKIFEYFELGVPIIALGVREQSDLEWLFLQLCGDVPRARTADEIARELQRVVDAPASLPRLLAREKLAGLEAEYGRVLARLSAPALPPVSHATRSAGSVS